jgi:DNA primase
MEHEHFTHPEAIRYLARKYNRNRNRATNEKANTDIRESMYLVSEFAKIIFIALLKQRRKAIGHSYFKERGFTRNHRKI